MTLDIQYKKLIIIFMVKDYKNATVKYVNWLMVSSLNIHGKKSNVMEHFIYYYSKNIF